MEWIRSGRPQEGERLREFAENCFKTDEETPDFARLLPKVYKTPQDQAPSHLVLETEEGVKGQLCLGITRWRVGDQVLKVGHIGAVCVASHYRGRGAMKRLMEEARYLLARESCVMIVLSGQRQRYQRYGFIPTGTKQEFVIYRENLGARAGEGYALRIPELKDLAEIERMFYKTPMGMERSRKEILDILGSWSAQPLVLEGPEGVCGYCTVFEQEGYGVVSELRVEKQELLKPLCGCLLAEDYPALKLCLTPLGREAVLAAQLCQRYIIGPDHNICVLKLDQIGEALLDFRHRQNPLPVGQAAIGIRGHGCLRLTVGHTEAAVRLEEEEDGRQEKSAIADRKDAGYETMQEEEITYEQAVEVLFSPLSPERQRLAAREPLLAAWLPLPLYIEQNDCY